MQIIGLFFIVSGIIVIVAPGFGEKYEMSGWGRASKRIGGVIGIVIGILLLGAG